MAARKSKKTRTGKKAQPARKSRLWLRDLLNILGGLLVGSLGFWCLTGYLDGRVTKKASEKTVEVIQDSASALKPFAERYLALEEGVAEGTSPLEGLDIADPVGALDSVRRVKQDFPDLPAASLLLVWDYTQNLHEAELIRKLIHVQQGDPEQTSQVLAREFLRALYEDSRIVQKLLWALKHPKEQG